MVENLKPIVTEILVATSSKDKIRELQTVATRYGLTLRTPTEIALAKQLPPPPDVDETGETYFDNALLKAEAYGSWAGMPALADDSGVEITALGNRPGVHSARYAGMGASSAVRIAKVLHELAQLEATQGTIDRSARFRCCLVLTWPDGTRLTADSVLEGYVLPEPKGDGGFGYDPIIYLHAIGSTLAEVDFAVTCEKGFRALAAIKLFEQLSK